MPSCLTHCATGICFCGCAVYEIILSIISFITITSFNQTQFENFFGQMLTFGLGTSLHGIILFLRGSILILDFNNETDAKKTFFRMDNIILCFFALIMTQYVFKECDQQKNALVCPTFVLSQTWTALSLIILLTRLFVHLNQTPAQEEEEVELSFIQQLPLIQAGRKNEACAICLFKDPTSWRVLPCTHSFHASCVDRWLTLQQTCPICRHKI